MSEPAIVTLADGFPPAEPAAWRALVEKTLKGASPESLVARIEGVEIAPLYTAANAQTGAPLARGPQDAERPFDLRAPILARDAASARSAILDALENGAASVLIDLTASPAGADALAEMLDGVLTDVAPIALRAGAQGAEAAERLSAAVKASPAAPLALHLDPIGARLESGASADVGDWARRAARLSALHPRASLFLADGAAAHERGATPAFELAFALSGALAYAKALVEAGLPMEDAFARIVLALAVDQRPLIGIAKLRAARRLWARVAQACGSTAPAAIEARSSHRMLTIADPWSNLIRLTIAAFAGAVGGADALVLYPHDAAAGSEHPLGPRLARNAGLVLMEEASLGRVIDPAAGAFALESLTDQLARSAWEDFTAIERGGGALAAIDSGLVEAKFDEGRIQLKQDLDDKRLKIVGVTDYPAGGSAPSPSSVDAGLASGQTFRLEALA